MRRCFTNLLSYGTKVLIRVDGYVQDSYVINTANFFLMCGDLFFLGDDVLKAEVQQSSNYAFGEQVHRVLGAYTSKTIKEIKEFRLVPNRPSDLADHEDPLVDEGSINRGWRIITTNLIDPLISFKFIDGKHGCLNKSNHISSYDLDRAFQLKFPDVLGLSKCRQEPATGGLRFHQDTLDSCDVSCDPLSFTFSHTTGKEEYQHYLNDLRFRYRECILLCDDLGDEPKVLGVEYESLY